MKLKIVLILIGLISLSSFANPQVLTIDTRQGVKQTFLLVAPITPPKAAMFMFPGGSGNLNIRISDGEILFNKNGFMQRTIDQFVANGMLVVLIDAPADIQDMSVNYRKTEEHTKDVEAVVSNVQLRYKNVPVYLLGISRGAVSVAYIAKQFKGIVSGIVSMSGHLADRGSVGLWGFDYKKLQQRILIVSHKNEGCPHTQYRDWLNIANRQSIDFIAVSGGHQYLEMSSGDRYPECRSWAHHNFLGIEKPVVTEIINWVLQKEFKHDVGD